ncbi:MAG: class I SAM-dependent methyltransferase [Acidobacteriota bacterium]
MQRLMWTVAKRGERVVHPHSRDLHGERFDTGRDLCFAGWGQKPEFAFFPEFRNVFTPQVRAENPAVTDAEILEKYAASLRAGGIQESEIRRRLGLIETERQALEIDMWNRIYTGSDPEFNQAPNAFLMQMTGGRTPGVALDYAMGEGRNAIYLAQRGWEVWGFDQSEAAIALAQKRAKGLGLVLKTSAVRDADFDFGKERFDLILFSWSMPQVPMDRVGSVLILR